MDGELHEWCRLFARIAMFLPLQRIIEREMFVPTHAPFSFVRCAWGHICLTYKRSAAANVCDDNSKRWPRNIFLSVGGDDRVHNLR